MNMVPQNEAAIHLLEAGHGIRLSDIPVVLRVVITQFRRVRPREETDQFAGRAFDNLKLRLSGAIEPVGSLKENTGATISASRTGIVPR
jgi:hypothetical protein